MSTKEEAIKSKGFEFCQSFMAKCCNSESTGEKAGEFDFEACWSIVERCCKGMNEKSNDKENN